MPADNERKQADSTAAVQGETRPPSISCLTIFWVFGLFLFAVASAKNLPMVLLGLTVTATYIVLTTDLRRYWWLGLVVGGMIVLVTLSFWTPIDIYVQTGPEFSFGMKPVVLHVHSLGPAAELYSKGMMPGKDFVVYRRMSAFNRVTEALTLTIPGRNKGMEQMRKDLEGRKKFVEQCEKERRERAAREEIE